jgi:hypothetical protein
MKQFFLSAIRLQKFECERSVRAAARDGEKLWGTDADPLANKGDWEKRLAKVSKQIQFHH